MSKAPTETEYSIPGAFPALALLSDLHGRDYQPVIASLKRHRPSLICVTGDFIYGSNPTNDTSPLVSQPNVLPFLTACGPIAPTYVSLGNHERVLDDADLHVIGSTGVTVLDNRYITTTVDGFDLVIGGLTSPYCLEYRKFREEYYREAVDTESHSVDATPLPRYPKRILADKDSKQEPKQRIIPDTSWLAEFAFTPGYHILLSHHPEFVKEIVSSVVADRTSVEMPIDLILSGHAHGGQWRVYHPIKHKWIGVFAPGQGFWPKLTEGVHEISSGAPGSLVISRGLANTSKIPRFFNRPEVVYISGAGKNCASVNKRNSENNIQT